MNHLKKSILLLTILATGACKEPVVQVPAAPAPASAPAPVADGSKPVAAPVGLAALDDAQMLAPMEASSVSCNVESIDDVRFEAKTFDQARVDAIVSGWLFPEHKPASDIRARLRLTSEDGSKAWEANIDQWVPRQDVVAVHTENYQPNPGFAQHLDFSALPVGKYHLVVVFDDSSKAFVCDNGRVINLK